MTRRWRKYLVAVVVAGRLLARKLRSKTQGKIKERERERKRVEEERQRREKKWRHADYFPISPPTLHFRALKLYTRTTHFAYIIRSLYVVSHTSRTGTRSLFLHLYIYIYILTRIAGDEKHERIKTLRKQPHKEGGCVQAC